MRFTAPISIVLGDSNAEAVRKNVDQRIREIQDRPAIGALVVAGVELPNATDVWVSHGLGREPSAVLVSPPYPNIVTVGCVHEVRGSSGASPIDRKQSIVLKADGFGTTVTVDVVVM